MVVSTYAGDYPPCDRGHLLQRLCKRPIGRPLKIVIRWSPFVFDLCPAGYVLDVLGKPGMRASIGLWRLELQGDI